MTSPVSVGSGALAKAFLQFEDNSRLYCLFNPDSISISRSNNWSGGDAFGWNDGESTPGKGVTTASYQGANSGQMTLELFFDTTDTGKPVTKYTGELWAAMDCDDNLPGADEGKLQARPQTVRFHWGENLVSFPSVIQDLTINFTYFSSAGTPLRAVANLTLKQYEDDDAFGPQNPTSGTPKPHRVHRVQPGETLDRISARYYGDATKWRALATANGVEDPLTVRPGSLIGIPRLESS